MPDKDRRGEPEKENGDNSISDELELEKMKKDMKVKTLQDLEIAIMKVKTMKMSTTKIGKILIQITQTIVREVLLNSKIKIHFRPTKKVTIQNLKPSSVT